MIFIFHVVILQPSSGFLTRSTKYNPPTKTPFESPNNPLQPDNAAPKHEPSKTPSQPHPPSQCAYC